MELTLSSGILLAMVRNSGVLSKSQMVCIKSEMLQAERSLMFLTGVMRLEFNWFNGMIMVEITNCGLRVLSQIAPTLTTSRMLNLDFTWM